MTRKRVTMGVGTLLAIMVLVFGAVGWYYAGEIRSNALDVDNSPSEPDLIVIAVGDGQVTLAVTEHTNLTHGDWQADGVFGMEWEGGFAQAGRIIAVAADQVTREVLLVSGQLVVGQAVNLGEGAFDGDPSQSHGIPFDEVTITSDIGDFPAWRVGGDSNWVIFTHGRGGSRESSLHLVDLATGLGLTSLVITYRNDPGVPPSESGFYDYGKSEWKDLDAAVKYAVDNGAEGVVLIGYSLGGAIIASFLYESELEDEVVGVVLDSPMIDFGDVVDYGGERRGLPGFLTNVGKLVAGFRYGIDWGDLDYLERVDELDVPVLLFHGGNDRRVHRRTSDRFAEIRPDLVTYLPFDDAEHVRSWNLDRARYEEAVVEFLGSVTR